LSPSSVELQRIGVQRIGVTLEYIGVTLEYTSVTLECERVPAAVYMCHTKICR